jgi:predicted NUDIX family NTP pyrophosphohydrolase
MNKISAGLLMFRWKNGERTAIEVLLVHPGGPFFRNQDDGAWSIPKGVPDTGDDLLKRAQIEFEEEVGWRPQSDTWIELGTITQKGGKVVHGWAFEGDLPQGFKSHSNTFLLEWPPRSGRMQEFPEVDRAEFFAMEEARTKIKAAQQPFLDRLLDALGAKR